MKLSPRGGVSMRHQYPPSHLHSFKPVHMYTPVSRHMLVITCLRYLITHSNAHAFGSRSASEKEVIRPLTVVRQVSLTIVSRQDVARRLHTLGFPSAPSLRESLRQSSAHTTTTHPLCTTRLDPEPLPSSSSSKLT